MGSGDPDQDTRRSAINWGQLVTGALVTGVAMVAFLQGRAATEAVSNCGELPGITSGFALLFGIVGALIIVIIAAVAARSARNRNVLVSGVLVAVALVGGIAVGERSATYACGPGGAGYVPGSTRQTAQLTLAFGEPYPGEQPSGRAECRRDDQDLPVRQVVSQGGHAEFLTDWRFGDPFDKFVDIEIYPTADSGYRSFDHLRIFINRISESDQGASASYSDGGAGTATLSVIAEGTSGRIDFSDLPAADVFGTGLPTTISGRITWACGSSQ